MKKIFISSFLAMFSGIAFSQVITQNAIPNTIQNGSSAACFGITNNGFRFTRDNSYIRVFRLQDFGINSDFTVTNVAFGVESASGNFPVRVSLIQLNGSITNGTGVLLDNADVNVSPANNLRMVNTGVNLLGVVPAGLAFIVQVQHNGANVTPLQAFFMGSHSAGQSAPSYLIAPGCNINNPARTQDVNFPQAKWVMTVTGHTNALGVTEVIDSQDIQVFPNPVKDVLKFRFSNQLKSEGIYIYDMSGKVITSIDNNKNVNEVNMSSVPKGNYILKVKADDGRLYVKKIIKN